MSARPIIGVIGGIGPHAGLDLVRRIHAETLVGTEQEHLDVVLASLPSRIPDRTEFLRGRGDQNPARGIVDAIGRCHAAGARLLGIACNTAHAPRIYDLVAEELARHHPDCRLVSIVDAVVEELARHVPVPERVGVLATSGAVLADVYGPALRAGGMEVLYPDAEAQEQLVHGAIYDPEIGIKQLGQAAPEARRLLLAAGAALIERGAGALILGCTEISMVIRVADFGPVRLADSNQCLARELVRQAAPAQLRPRED